MCNLTLSSEQVFHPFSMLLKEDQYWSMELSLFILKHEHWFMMPLSSCDKLCHGNKTLGLEYRFYWCNLQHRTIKLRLKSSMALSFFFIFFQIALLISKKLSFIQLLYVLFFESSLTFEQTSICWLTYWLLLSFHRPWEGYSESS